jgi:hypothetical protein
MATIAEALQAVHHAIATDSRDWSLARGDAWLYAVLVGWDCEDDPIGAFEEVATRHAWTAAQRSRIRELRAAVRLAAETEAP